MAALSYHVSFDYSVIRFPKNNHCRKNMRHFCHLVYNEKGLCNVIGYVSHIGVVLPETSKFSFVCLFVRFYCVSKKHFLLFFKIVMDIDHKHYFKYKQILYLFFFFLIKYRSIQFNSLCVCVCACAMVRKLCER